MCTRLVPFKTPDTFIVIWYKLSMVGLQKLVPLSVDKWRLRREVTGF